MEWTGGCLCGAIRYRANASPFWVGHCHCKKCQRSTGSPTCTWVAFAPNQLEWTRGDPSYFQSSKKVQRSFCSSCGSPLGFHHAEHDGVTAGTLDKPETLKAEVHMFAEHEYPWAKIDDGLPRHEGFLPEDQEFDDPSLHQ